MNTISNILYSIKNEENQEFDIFNNKLEMKWTLRFEFIDNSILMMVNNSTLTSEWFDSLEEVKYYLDHSFLTDKNFEIH
tara:strand:+ start:5409 stop:5645 length:237 start_codon:yes stop_codon:yes gene_type:complete